MMRNLSFNSKGEKMGAFLYGFASASSLAIVTYCYSSYFHNGFSSICKRWRAALHNKDEAKSSYKETVILWSDSDDETNATSTTVMDSPYLSNRILRKAETVIQGRTSRVVVVVERCTNDHNYSAILRTVEALGIQHVWLIAPPSVDVVYNSEEDEEVDADHCSNNMVKNAKGNNVKQVNECDVRQRQQHHLFAQRAVEWLTIRNFDTAESCLQALYDDKRTIWVTDLSQDAVCLTTEGLANNGSDEEQQGIMPERLAIVFGTEAVGCTQTMLQAAHQRVYLPLTGFADSLNLSVAAALCILQLFHLCPEMVGQMSEGERKELRTAWFSKLAAQRITTTGMRKMRTRTIAQLKRIDEIERKKDAGESLHVDQVEKLKGAAELRKKFQELEDDIQCKAKIAVQYWIDNPPESLSDMRRADMHRVCYVGGNTRKKNQENWKGMPATSNVPGVKHGALSEFRNLVPNS